MESGYFTRLECEKVARMRSFRKKDKGLAKVHFLTGEERSSQRSNARRGAE